MRKVAEESGFGSAVNAGLTSTAKAFDTSRGTVAGVGVGLAGAIGTYLLSGLWDRKNEHRLSRLLASVGIGAGLGLGTGWATNEYDKVNTDLDKTKGDLATSQGETKAAQEATKAAQEETKAAQEATKAEQATNKALTTDLEKSKGATKAAQEEASAARTDAIKLRLSRLKDRAKGMVSNVRHKLNDAQATIDYNTLLEMSKENNDYYEKTIADKDKSHKKQLAAAQEEASDARTDAIKLRLSRAKDRVKGKVSDVRNKLREARTNMNYEKTIADKDKSHKKQLADVQAANKAAMAGKDKELAAARSAADSAQSSARRARMSAYAGKVTGNIRGKLDDIKNTYRRGKLQADLTKKYETGAAWNEANDRLNKQRAALDVYKGDPEGRLAYRHAMLRLREQRANRDAHRAEVARLTQEINDRLPRKQELQTWMDAANKHGLFVGMKQNDHAKVRELTALSKEIRDREQRLKQLGDEPRVDSELEAMEQSY